MGIELDWKNNVSTTLQDFGLNIEPIVDEKCNLLLCNHKLAVNLLSLNNDHSPCELIELQSRYQAMGIYLVQLWEDVWQSRTEQVLGRIKSILGLNKRLHARKATVMVIDQKHADIFLTENHLQASAKARYKFSLDIEGETVAVACFSNLRRMKNTTPYRSAELIRFATRTGYTITGGFSKLLKHFIKSISPDDVMSYADRDWSLGNAYQQAGFKLVETTVPAQIWLDKQSMIRYFPHRLPEGTTADENFVPVYNTGNLKYILYL